MRAFQEPTVATALFLILVPFFGFAPVASANSVVDARSENVPFSFDTMAPSESLKWTPCFENYTCALLEVPLDYQDPSAGTIAVAFTKWTSKNPKSNDILLNPGGPGSSGVSLVTGPALPALINSLGQDHNIVGFDIRGVNNSGPSLSCFTDQAANQNLFDMTYFRDTNLDDPRGLSRRYAAGEAYGKWCTQALKNTTARYANTVAYSNDMLRYAEKLAESKGEDPKNAKVWFWGLSYGTVLAQTFATLFPDRVGRIISDGNTGIHNYYYAKWDTVYPHGDEAMRTFFEYCHEAGPSKCAFHAESATAIEKRFTNLLLSLKSSPVPVTTQGLVQLPNFVDDVDVLSVFRPATMRPLGSLGGFAYMAETLAALERKNATLLVPLVSLNKINANFTADAKLAYNEKESQIQISCIDANGRGGYPTLASFADYIQYSMKQSAYLGTMAGPILTSSCKTLDIRPPKSQVFDPAKAGANSTCNPLLFIGNTIDPTTPLSSAREGHARFPTSGLLIQNSVGHLSLSAPSKCTSKYIQEYLRNATVPEANTVCQPGVLPFHGTWL